MPGKLTDPCTEAMHQLSLDTLQDYESKSGWSYEGEPLMVLVVIGPSTTSLTKDACKELFQELHSLKEQGKPECDLSEFVIVTSLQTCESYATFISPTQRGYAYYGFGPKDKKQATWKTYSKEGFWSIGSWTKDKPRYTVLLTLQNINGEEVNV